MQPIPSSRVAEAYHLCRDVSQNPRALTEAERTAHNKAGGVILAFLNLVIAKSQRCTCDLRDDFVQKDVTDESGSTSETKPYGANYKSCTCYKAVNDLAQGAWSKLEDHFLSMAPPIDNPAGYIYKIAMHYVEEARRSANTQKRGGNQIHAQYAESPDGSGDATQTAEALAISSKQIENYQEAERRAHERAVVAESLKVIVRRHDVDRTAVLIYLRIEWRQKSVKEVARAYMISPSKVYRDRRLVL